MSLLLILFLLCFRKKNHLFSILSKSAEGIQNIPRIQSCIATIASSSQCNISRGLTELSMFINTMSNEVVQLPHTLLTQDFE